MRQSFASGLLIVDFAYLFSLNVINMDAIIARENLRRFEQGAELDFYYLNTLSADVTPDIFAFWQRTSDPLAKQDAGVWLANRYARLSSSQNADGLTPNISRVNAKTVIEGVISELPPADRNYVPHYHQETSHY